MAWEERWHATHFATMGEHFEWNGLPDPDGAMVPMDPQPSGPMTDIESGEDWWYAHCNIYENGQLTGYIAAGYAGWKNFQFVDGQGCFAMSFQDPPRAEELESLNARKGGIVQAIARYDLAGNMVWCRQLLIGTFYGVTQTTDGSFLAVGEASSNRKLGVHLQAYPGPIRYNPGQGAGPDVSGVDCSTIGTMIIKTCAMKIDGNGTVEWLNLYSMEEDYEDAWPVGGRGFAACNIRVAGEPAYYMVSGNGGAVGWRLTEEGDVIDRHLFAGADPVFPPELGLQNVDAATLYDVEMYMDNGVQRMALAGRVFPPGFDQHAVLIYLSDIDADPYGLGATGFTKHTLLSELDAYHNDSKAQHCSGFTWATQSGVPRLIWPVLSDYVGPVYGTVPKYAQLNVHSYALDGTRDWTAILGEVRAYDLQADAIATTTDEGVAVVSTKWHRPGGNEVYSNNNPFRYEDLSPDQVTCLNTDFNGFGWSTQADNGNGLQLYDYWNTDTYVAKLDMDDGHTVWETTFDADANNPVTCYPHDVRDQECMYKITETQDGGLVVSGNTSHNLDDAYLAKLHPDCQSFVAYDVPIATAVMNSPDRSYTVGANEFWTTDKNIHGTIIIPAGHSLTINNAAVIRFADSHQLEHSTRMLVEPGGKLLINGGAVLTSIGSCPGSMWDGIVVKGTNESQDGNNYADQGYAYVREATIENARTALITNNQFLDGDDLAAYQLQFAGGGVIRTRGATFRNNKRDVVMGPYENHAPNDHSEIRVNRSYFHDCDFVVDAPLNDHARPLEHMALYGVRNIPILGCDFAGTPYQPDQNSPMSMDAGLGVRGLNASFIIAPFCPVIVPYGEPCPTPIPSTFDRLTLGVEVAGITDDKTFSIDQAVFTRCPRSIRMDAVRDAAITNNRIDVADWTHPFAVGTPYGVYSDECTGYEIEDNAFTASTATDHARAGLVIKNSGHESNRVYNNTFDDFGYKNSTALLIQGRNANPDDNYLTGLEVKCNDFGQSGNKNAYDVALTGESTTVRAKQGRTFDNPLDYTAPASNRFSLLGEEESDWHVANSSNFVVYYHHNGSSEPFIPQYFDALYFHPEPAFGFPPANWNEACPSNQRSRDRERSGMMAGSEEKSEELQASKNAYDANLDNGDTYSLLGYVSDPSHTSIQVRNALQSVAPKVSMEVWNAAFDRNPAMNPWNLTQALLSNSPSQPEVMKLCYESSLSDFYYNLVASAQNGINPLDILESDISTYASGKAEDLTDLGRWSWLDSTGVDSAITLLKSWHDQLPADNGDAVLTGYFSAKGDNVALYDLAAALEAASITPGVYGVLKHYANAQQALGWTQPDAAASTYLGNLAQNRWDLGSARAGSWLQALGADPLEEVVILPVEERAMVATRRVRSTTSSEAIILEAYPNPTDGLAYVVCNVPEGVEQALVRVHDLSGRTVVQQRLAPGAAIVELDLTGHAAGIYAAELELDGVRSGTVKLTVQ